MEKTLSYVQKILEELVKTPSPSGYCDNILQIIETQVCELGFAFSRTVKGNGLIHIPCCIEKKENEKGILLTGHVDTLGGMVRSISADGKIRMTSVGGFMMQSVEGEYCTIHMRNQQTITGTILSKKPSVHVYDDAKTMERIESNMEIRLDANVSTKEDVEELGVCVGDYISFDPRFSVGDSGYIKSRHLDDKAGVAILLGLLFYMKEKKITFQRDITIMLSTYEEVGHGASYIPKNIDTLLAIDMGAIGDDLACTEKDVSICAKDSRGPYDYHIVGELMDIAKRKSLSYVVDIYPNYGSDASAALAGGHNIRAGLIGPGVHASHTLERTHIDGLKNTLQLLIGWLEQQ